MCVRTAVFCLNPSMTAIWKRPFSMFGRGSLEMLEVSREIVIGSYLSGNHHRYPGCKYVCKTLLDIKEMEKLQCSLRTRMSSLLLLCITMNAFSCVKWTSWSFHQSVCYVVKLNDICFFETRHQKCGYSPNMDEDASYIWRLSCLIIIP